MSVEGKKLRRSPIPSGPLTCASLGSVLEVEFGGNVWTWKRGACELLWHQNSKSLIWFDATPIEIEPTENKSGAAIAAFRRFKDRDPGHVRGERFDISRQWVALGAAERVDYHSDKWGQSASYTHDLGPRVRLFRGGSPRGPWIYVLRGGNLHVSRRGLVG